jgi:adenylate kinase
MNLILLGPPGAGKGTQAKSIAAAYHIPHISTGDMFRETAQSGSDLGKKLQSYMSAGKLVPDDVVIEVVQARLAKQDSAQGFLLDGFPRTVPQAQALDTMLASSKRTITAVLSIGLSEEEIIHRLSSRRVCGACGGSFNLVSQPPKKEGICDFCGGKLMQRSDDNPSTIRQRLQAYTEQTSPLIAYYTHAGLLRAADGAQSVDQVFRSLTASLKG